MAHDSLGLQGATAGAGGAILKRGGGVAMQALSSETRRSSSIAQTSAAAVSYEVAVRGAPASTSAVIAARLRSIGKRVTAAAMHAAARVIAMNARARVPRTAGIS